MILISGYQIVTPIYESSNSLVYRGIREADEQPIILKVLKENYPTPQELARYRTEYQITQSLNVPGVVKVYDLQKYQNTLVMFVEDFGGESLKHWMQQRPFNLEEFLRVAIAVTEALGQIHAANIIHKDTNPSNIVFNPTTGQVKIIDFGISTQLTRENTTLKNPNVLEGTLAYMSPEQTGRMNRAMDYRTDFYSLGVTFYELLTNRLPFETTDPLELVHCHIARQPVPPADLNPEIPSVLSAIVLKLMAKTAEERYQSAYGLKADLEECLRQYNNTGSILEFSLGSQDISDKFQLPQKLYGREKEIETLVAAFSRASSQSQLMLVSGYSGIGKSALVQELYKPITEKRGYFSAGKFDQYQRNIPYSAIVTAFQGLVKQLLTESEAQLNQWQEKLVAALGVNGQVIIEVIPEIELIIGQQPALPELGPNESQNRFNLVFQNFIKVFTQPEHPLALFIDDLQWADGASLKLMQLLMSAGAPGLFLIGAYRDNEVSAVHPLMLTLDEIGKTGAIVERIFLSPLTLPTIAQLIGDTLKCEVEPVMPLAELVQVKTGGNPFFMSEFLKSLYAETLLDFDTESLSWQWDLERIQARGFTDNVVELMTGKIQKLPEDTQEILKLAACIGNQFDLEILGFVAEQSLNETVAALQAAVVESLVVPLVNSAEVELAVAENELQFGDSASDNLQLLEYQFVHDRIQQAAYSLIPEEEKANVHQRIGQLLLQNTPEDKREDKIFEIVNQLNFGINFISQKQLASELAQLNLIAGKKAKASAAYQPALNYLQIGIGLLGESGWQQEYDLTLSLHRKAAEAAYLIGKFERMEEIVEMVIYKYKNIVDKVPLVEIKIAALLANNRLKESLELGLKILEELGEVFPRNPNHLNILIEFIKTKLILAGKQIDDLYNLPPMANLYKLAAASILSKISPLVYFFAPRLLPLIVFRQVILSIKYGISVESIYAYASYGLVLCGVVGDIEQGYAFGQQALKILERLSDKTITAKAFFMVNAFITHWKTNLKESLRQFLEAYKSGLETGDLEYAAYNAFMYCSYSYLLGFELSELAVQIAAYSKAIELLNQKPTLSHIKTFQQAVLNLLGMAEASSFLMGDAYDEHATLSSLNQAKNRTSIFSHYFNKIILCYLFEQNKKALLNASLAEQYLDSGIGTLTIVYFYFYFSLAQLAILLDSNSIESRQLLKKVIKNQKKMKNWAKFCPANKFHKYLIVEAEIYRIQGKDKLAINFYDRAIALAKENEYIHEAALAYELAAKFYLSRGKELTARAYMQEARYCYQLWGAAAKVQHLETRYPELLTVSRSEIKGGTVATTTGSGNLDIATVMKASQAISGEIMLDKLLSSLMKILLENAGAQRGYLILSVTGELLIEAEGTIDDEQQITVLKSIPVINCPTISAAIVSYVARTQEVVVLDDATREGNFTSDSYIQETQLKSILCVPLIDGGKLVSIVYLENNRSTGAFTPERVEIVKLLSGQAAISIQNAKLYGEVRDNESRLTQFLEAIPVGVAILENSGNVYYTNRIAQQLLGQGVVPNTTLEKIAEIYQLYKSGTQEEYPSPELPIVRALKGESSTADDIEIHQGDKVIPIEGWGTPIYDAKGNITYSIAAFQDITERKKAEADRQRFTNELFQLNKAYERFVPHQFLQFLEKSSIVDVELGDQVQLEMSVLFSDIRSFTTLSESMTPEDNFKFINAYLRRMEPGIIENQGFIDKYIGDAIMALFSGDADNAVKAGISMLHRLDEYNQHRMKSGYVPIQNGIGINAGSLMLGTVGGYNRMDGTVISDAVNLASRIEGLTKNYGVSLLISHNTFLRLKEPENYAIRLIDNVKVKGKSEIITVYEVFDADPPQIKEGKQATLQVFTEALSFYKLAAFSEAAGCFHDCLRHNPKDTVAQIYLERCQQQMG